MTRRTVQRSALAILLLGMTATGVLILPPDAIGILTFLAYTLVGTYLVVRRPRNAVGWLLIAVAWLGVTTTTAATLEDAAAIDAGAADLATELRFWSGPALGSLVYVAYAALGFVFPSGSLPRGRRGRRIRALLLGSTVLVVLPALLVSTLPFQVAGTDEFLVRNPFVVRPLLDPVAMTALPLVVTLIPIAALAVAVVDTTRRYRSADEILRLQLRWLTASIAFVVFSVAFGLVMWVALGDVLGGLGWIFAQVAGPIVPFAVAAAVLRYRLFEIDRIVSRTIAWVVVTIALAAVFAAGIVGLSTALHEVTNGDDLAVAASTLVAAVLFQPLRRRVQGAVDRRFDRARVDGEHLAEAFADQLRSQVDLPRLVDGLTTTAKEGVRPSAAGVWIRPGHARS